MFLKSFFFQYCLQRPYHRIKSAAALFIIFALFLPAQHYKIYLDQDGNETGSFGRLVNEFFALLQKGETKGYHSEINYIFPLEYINFSFEDPKSYFYIAAYLWPALFVLIFAFIRDRKFIHILFRTLEPFMIFGSGILFVLGYRLFSADPDVGTFLGLFGLVLYTVGASWEDVRLIKNYFNRNL